MALRIIVPSIFPKNEIIAGVTERNLQIHPLGFSFGETNLFDKTTVKEHRRILANQLGIDISDFVYLNQKHSDTVIVFVDKFETLIGDALITNVRGKVLVVKIADCGGVLIYDKKKEVVAAIHSGWRGSYKRIVRKTVSKMRETFNSKPEDLLVFVSPLPFAEKYEVGAEVAELFENSIIKSNEGKFFFDNRKEILFQLREIGIPSINIEVSNQCTISNTNLHSYRRDQEKSGRMACFIGLKG